MEFLHVSMCVSMSPFGLWTQNALPHPHVDTDMKCLHVSMWIWVRSIYMFPCGYRHGVSSSFHVEMDMECLHVSMWIWTSSVSMACPHGYGHRMSPFLHDMDTTTEGLHISMCISMSLCSHEDMDMGCLQVSMWKWKWSVSMSPCGYGHGVSLVLHVFLWICTCYVSISAHGYGHGVSPCLLLDRDTECLHISMWIWTWSVSMSSCGYKHRMPPCMSIQT